MTVYQQTSVRTQPRPVDGTGTVEQDFLWLLHYQPDMVPSQIPDTAEAVKKYKEDQGRFFIAGKFNKPVRHNENLDNRTMLALDFDELDTQEKFIAAIKKALPDTEWYAYPSITYGLPGRGIRYRLVVRLSRAYLQSEHLALIYGVAKMIGYPIDDQAKDWVRIMGLPVLNRHSGRPDLIHHEGAPLAVDDFLVAHPYEAPKADTAASRQYVAAQTGNTEADLPGKNFIDGITASKMIEDWAMKHEAQLQSEGEFTSVMIYLIQCWRAGWIDEITARTAMKTLALGNEQWAINNFNKFNAHLTMAYQPPRVPFRARFNSSEPPAQWQPTRVRLMTKTELKQAVIQDHSNVLTRINEDAKPGQEKKSLSPAAVGKLLKRHIPMWRTEDRDGALIYLYDPDKGIYDGSPLQLQRWVQLIEPNYDEPKVKKVAYFLQGIVPVKEPEDDPMLVPVGNGIFDYRTKTLHPFGPEYFFIAKTATNYVAHCQEPTLVNKQTGEIWRPSEFIMALAVNNPQVIQLLFEVIADAANGNYSRRQAIFLVGSMVSTSENGSNGKGTFQDLVQAIVGDENTAHLKVDEMDQRFAIINLLGKSVNIGDDLQASVYIDNSSSFNSAVTGDVLYSDVKNKKPVAFRFKGAMIQSTNEMPRFKNKTGGTYRRMVLVPFNAHFSGDNDNPDVKNDYIYRKEVREWFLSRALEMPFFKRFTTPDVSKTMLDDFKLENDPIRQFVDDELQFDNHAVWRLKGDPQYSNNHTLSGVYDRYRAWAQENGFSKPVSQKTFTQQLKGLLNETPIKKTTITPQEWEDLKHGRKELHEVIPLAEAAYSYKQAMFSTGNERVIEFGTRKQIDDALTIKMPAQNTPEYLKQKSALQRLQTHFLA